MPLLVFNTMNNQKEPKDMLHILMNATVEALLETVGPIMTGIVLKKITDKAKDGADTLMLEMRAEINKMKGVKVS